MLSDNRTHTKRTQFHYRRDAISRSYDRNKERRHAMQMVKDEEAFVARCALTLALLGVTPLMLFLVVHYVQRWF